MSIADVANGNVRQTLTTDGTSTMPRWSPAGDRIVFNDDTTLYLINVDGSGRRRVGPQHFYYPRADWSADGIWLIARTRNHLELINASTNDVIPMPPWTLPYLYPAWKR